MDVWNVVHGHDLQPIANVDLSNAEQQFGTPVWAVHRVDLHNELWRLAVSETENEFPVQINLASEVIAASTDGSVTLRDRSQHTADLIVAADGLHSVLKGVVLEQEAIPAAATGLCAFRFLVETQKLESSEQQSATLKKKGPGATLLADTRDTTNERHIMWYPCRKSVHQLPHRI